MLLENFHRSFGFWMYFSKCMLQKQTKSLLKSRADYTEADNNQRIVVFQMK